MKRLKISALSLITLICTVCGCVGFCIFSNSSSYALSVSSTASLPASYDSRDINIVTPVKDQGDTNLCWAYSSIAVAETSILKSGIDSTVNNTNLSLSPIAVGYSRYKRNVDPLNNTPGEYSSTDYLKASGNPTYAETLFSQWCGPIYNNISANADCFENSAYRFVESSQIYNDNLSKDQQIIAIKNAIVKYGAVTFSYNNVREKYYYNPKNETGDDVYPHACTLIGWDDNILATNFEPNGATQNGGWLVKNSYNSLPYFYLSYDTSISSFVYAFKFEKKDKYDYNYFYDYEFNDFLNYTKNCKFAGNIYQAKKGGDGEHAEYLKAVNVAVLGKNYSCDVEIYTNLTDTSDPTSGDLSATATASFETSGYKTISLTSPVKLTANSKFGVVVRLNGDSGAVLRLAHCSSQSFEKTSSGWRNLSSCTARIKAFTSLVEETELQIDISEAEISNVANYVFTGSSIEPQIQVTVSNIQLIESKDYVIEYSNNINVGQAQIIVKGTGKYTGTKTVQFNITSANIQSCDMNVAGSFTYNTKPQKPKVTAKFNGVTLVEDVDYHLEYENNVKAGDSAIIQVLGMGNFGAVARLNFTIQKANKPTKEFEQVTINTDSASVLADISLPAGWVWADATIKITADLNSAYIVYVGEDKDNYIETTCLINIQQTTDKKPSQEESTSSKTLLQKQFYITFSVVIALVFVIIAVVLIAKKKRY